MNRRFALAGRAIAVPVRVTGIAPSRKSKETDMPVPIKRLAWKDFPWLYCIGATLLLLSWLGEKHLDRDFARKRNELERLQRQVSSDHNVGQLWFSHMLLLSAQEPKNPQAIAFASLWYMEYTLNALDSAVAWGNENMAERRKFVEVRQSQLVPAKAAFEAGQYEKVTTLASHVRTFELQSASRLASANAQRLTEIDAQRGFWDWVISGVYVIGAGLIGFAFVRSRLRARDPAELTTYIDPPYKGRG
jgi:hypothetical protein